ncbi:MAG: cupredoxin domain-containing protein [Gemmatimonadota bacterium]
MRTRGFFGRQIVAALCITLGTSGAIAADEFALTIKDHRFQPTEVRVPANTKVKLVITNKDSTAEEFESHTMNREKIIPPGGTITVFIGPLKPGRYPFVGEYHEKTAQGVVIAE